MVPGERTKQEWQFERMCKRAYNLTDGRLVYNNIKKTKQWASLDFPNITKVISSIKKEFSLKFWFWEMNQANKFFGISFHISMLYIVSFPYFACFHQKNNSLCFSSTLLYSFVILVICGIFLTKVINWNWSGFCFLPCR